MPSSKFSKFQTFLLILLMSVSFFYGGYYFGKRGYSVELKRNPPKVEITNKFPGNQKLDFALFWDVWDKISSDYLERPVDAQKMMYGAISGMVASLGDPYTSFLPPVVNKGITEAINGQYEGIGAELGIKDNQLIVVAPLDGSPAKSAGIISGDKILAIDGETTNNITLTDAVAKIRGPKDTGVTLTIQHDTEPAVDKKINRGVITVASVTWEDKGAGVAYIRVSRFGGETNKEWNTAVSEINIKMRELDSVIVDVRGNPGGYLQSAVYLAGEFFKNKPVVYEESAEGVQVPLSTDRVGIFQNVPKVFVLIDEGSASASEILAAALRAQISAKLIGTESFGKGTIQDAKDFKDGSAVHITIAKWLTPDKQWIHKIGLNPDVEVKFTQDDLNNNVDVQLNKAIELAKKL